ncbi:SIS domain-containing protein [Methylosinus sp. Ce-a6]|uniref:SIS domain-containing protein n=1 Tax=Methylosinus sp. Ce-a6 TaxID=2172005 RepID=UPI0027392576|nr:SIS domain-containing protein [Methylosinus sp. Ce-a6]
MLALASAKESAALKDGVARAVEALTACLKAGGKILLAGNGGSAGDAQHIAGEFLSRLVFDRPALAAIALTTDTSVLTAIGNDYGYDKVFERQVLGLANKGDVLIAISTSGRSPNILRAMEAGRKAGCVVIGFTGANSAMASLCDVCLEMPSTSTPIIQQLYMVIAHALCGAVEADMFPDAAREAAQK